MPYVKLYNSTEFGNDAYQVFEVDNLIQAAEMAWTDTEITYFKFSEDGYFLDKGRNFIAQKIYDGRSDETDFTSHKNYTWRRETKSGAKMKKILDLWQENSTSGMMISDRNEVLHQVRSIDHVHSADGIYVLGNTNVYIGPDGPQYETESSPPSFDG